MKRKSPTSRHHPLGNIPTGHRWDRIAMDILNVCDPSPDGYRYILVIADYFSKWTEAFPIKDKCADTVADVMLENVMRGHGGGCVGRQNHFTVSECPWLSTAIRGGNLKTDS